MLPCAVAIEGKRVRIAEAVRVDFLERVGVGTVDEGIVGRDRVAFGARLKWIDANHFAHQIAAILRIVIGRILWVGVAVRHVEQSIVGIARSGIGIEASLFDRMVLQRHICAKQLAIGIRIDLPGLEIVSPLGQ